MKNQCNLYILSINYKQGSLNGEYAWVEIKARTCWLSQDIYFLMLIVSGYLCVFNVHIKFLLEDFSRRFFRFSDRRATHQKLLVIFSMSIFVVMGVSRIGQDLVRLWEDSTNYQRFLNFFIGYFYRLI